MRIHDKIHLDYDGLIEHGPITIVTLGDSVTHGCFGPDEIDYDACYGNRLREKILAVRNYVPVNLINAGIGGITAAGSLDRLESQVLCHRPDLVTVCFGLNDVNGELASYLAALREIFARCRETGAEVIFLTPNMLNTYVAEGTPPQYLDYAAVTARFQNEGKMDAFMDGARALAVEMGIPVCDCYAVWKERSRIEDTTLLLDNRINHPSREMHMLFADMLFAMVMGEDSTAASAGDGMYRG